MWKSALKVVVLIVALGSVASEANAFGHRGWGGCGGGWGYGGCGGGGCGYGGWAGGYGGWGYGGWGYGGRGYGGWGYPGYFGPGYIGPGFGSFSAAPARVNTSTTLAADNAILTVEVPADAKIFVNDHLTTTTGTVRQYLSRGLKPGATYQYQVRAEFTRGDKPVTEEKTVQITAGQNVAVNFTTTPEQIADTAPARR